MYSKLQINNNSPLIYEKNRSHEDIWDVIVYDLRFYQNLDFA
jgi:hypothetical protein